MVLYGCGPSSNVSAIFLPQAVVPENMTPSFSGGAAAKTELEENESISRSTSEV